MKAGEVFYYGDEVNLSWRPTLRAMWSRVGRQIMIPTPGAPRNQYGIGAVNYHTGQIVFLVRKRKRRIEIAEFLRALMAEHPHETVYLVWDNVNTHEGPEIDLVLKEADGRLVLLYLPTYSPWLNPIEMLWRHLRRQVTHCELFETPLLLQAAALDFIARLSPEKTLSVIGSNSALPA